jgi:hypothetical protein
MSRPPDDDVEDIEEQAAQNLAESGLPPETSGEPVIAQVQTTEVPITRLAVVIAFPVLAAAAMTGGVFVGYGARFWAAFAGVLGVALAVGVRRFRRPLVTYLLAAVGVFAIGLFLVIPSGMDNLFDLGAAVRAAVRSGDIQRPPVQFEPGWRAILGWLMGALGFAAAWLGIEMQRPALAMLVPLPVIAFTAISVPDSDQLPTGIACLVFFVVGLGLLSGTEMGDKEQRPSLAYELRRGARAVPVLGVIVGVIFALSQLGFLFPPPIIDPAQEAKKPKTVPLSKVKDRVLFRVKSSITGPWRIGHLDVYDGSDWRLPPFAASELKEVPRSGVVDSELEPGVKATFEVGELEGAVLPSLPNTVGIVAEGPKLAFDPRLGNIRLTQGSIESGLTYTVVASAVPTVENIRSINQDPPPDIKPFLEIPDPPPAVKSLLNQAPTNSAWDRMNYLRETFLKTVVASGSGVPVSVPPKRVDDMLAGSKEGTPYEIVAAQAMLARWAGVPSRIAYGYDGGDKAEGYLEVRPKHGASFLELYFPTYKWLPVIGTPLQAKSSLSSDPQQFNPNVLASDDVAVRIHIPIATDARSLLFAQIRSVFVSVAPIIIGLLLIYYTWPFLWKTIVRSRRRGWAHNQGAEARIAVAYAEWRDTATDFGYRWDSDTPLMFLDRIVEDEENTELAWLVTRTLWGDLRGRIRPDDALAAEELSKSLRKRLSQGHPFTLRVIAAVSRLSLRYPYATIQTMRPRREPAYVPAPA